MGGCDGVVGTGGGGGPGGFLIVLFRGGAWGVGARADVDPRVCAQGVRLGVRRGLAAAAVVGHALYVGCHRGLVGGRGRCWRTLASFWPGWGRSVGMGCGLGEVAGRGASCFGRGALRHEGGGGGVGDRGGAPRWALLPSSLGRLGPNVIEDVLGGSGSRCRRGAGFGLGFGLGCGLRSWRADGFGWLFGGGLGFRLGRGCGPRRGVGLGGGGVARGGGVFGGPFGRCPPRPWGVECWMRTWWWRWMRWSWWWRLWSRRRRRGLWETAEGPGLRGRAYDAGSCK